MNVRVWTAFRELGMSITVPTSMNVLTSLAPNQQPVPTASEPLSAPVTKATRAMGSLVKISMSVPWTSMNVPATQPVLIQTEPTIAPVTLVMLEMGSTVLTSMNVLINPCVTSMLSVPTCLVVMNVLATPGSLVTEPLVPTRMNVL